MIYSALKHIKDRLQGKAPSKCYRSPKWPKTRKEHLKKFSKCQVCNGNKKLEVHHIVPFHIDKSLELETNNLITLCESKKNGINCHLLAGHLGCFQSYNIYVIADSKTWKEKIRHRPVNKQGAVVSY